MHFIFFNKGYISDNNEYMRKTKIEILKNAFLSSFLVIEELLNEIESFFEVKKRIFVKIKKTTDRESMLLKIGEIKEILKELKKKFNIKEEEITDTAIVNSRCAKIWEILNDLKSEKLKRYGEIPEEIKKEIDPLIEKMIVLINEIVDLTNKKV